LIAADLTEKNDEDAHILARDLSYFRVLKNQTRVADSAEELQAGMDELYTGKLY
jgi:hypothetical protein